MDVLGRPFSEAELLALAYAYEQATHPRRAPFVTPALVNDKAPPPVTWTIEAKEGNAAATISLTLDRPLRRLVYRALVAGVAKDDLFAVTLHEAADGGRGPVLERLLAPGAVSGSGEIILSAAEIDALQKGRAYIAVRARRAELRAPVRLP
jgi:hypothetical protein